MFGLQDIFQKQIERIQPHDLLLKIIKKKLLDLGVRLNQSQVKIIGNQLKATEPTITFEITDQQVARAKIKSQTELENAIRTTLSDITSEANEIISKLENSLSDIIESTAEVVSESVFRRIRRSYRFGLKERREAQSQFEEDLYGIWGNAINQLEVLLYLAIEAAEHMLKIVERSGSSYSKAKWMVLSRLHARALQITGEILALVKTGYADGAKARWRSLHEVTVVAAFIFEQEDEVSEQYLAHDVIEEYKSVVQQAELWPDLKEDEEYLTYLNELKIQKTDLILQYGRVFSEDYGWAANALEGQRPTFREIEKKVNLTHFRPDYREASHNVHAGVRGTFARLGLPPGRENLLLSGASDFGLADPGHLTAMSLTQATVSLLQGTTNEAIDSIVVMKVIQKQAHLTRKEFWRCHRRITKVLMHQSVK